MGSSATTVRVNAHGALRTARGAWSNAGPSLSKRAFAVSVFGLAVLLPTVLVPSEADGGRGPCPASMALVSVVGGPKPFCIDRWEASLITMAGGREVAHSPYDQVKGEKVIAVSRAGVIPQAHVSRNDAEAACHAAKKRLCAEDEWVRACQGRVPTTFPYGEDRHDGYCNDQGRAPLSVVFPNDPTVFQSSDKMNDPRLNQVPGSLARTGTHAHCKNGFGLFDMVGNVHEWVADPAGTFRGGYYLDTKKNGDGCKYRTDAHDASYRDYSTGFRCCANPR